RIPVNVIVTDSTSATVAAFDATRTIPIVMGATGGDPIALGLAKSLSRPGGNVTGTQFLTGLSDKRLQLLKQAFPGAQRVAVLANPTGAISVSEMPKAEMAASRIGLRLVSLVFVMGADPVKLGVVASLNQPSGNVTGVTQFYGALGGKRLEFIRELVRTASIIAVLTNPRNPNPEDHLSDVRAAAHAMGQRILVFAVSAESEIAPAFAGLRSQGANALLVADDPFFSTRRDQIVAQAARGAMPAIYYTREFAEAGGLISYGSNPIANYIQAGAYVARILKGTAPADLPIQQPTKFELVVNLKTAKTLGLTVPLTLQAAADEVIE